MQINRGVKKVFLPNPGAWVGGFTVTTFTGILRRLYSELPNMSSTSGRLISVQPGQIVSNNAS